MFLFCTLFCFVLLFLVYLCLQHFSAMLHLVNHDCVTMSCSEMLMEAETQGGATAACGQDLQDMGLHKGNAGI